MDNKCECEEVWIRAGGVSVNARESWSVNASLNESLVGFSCSVVWQK